MIRHRIFTTLLAAAAILMISTGPVRAQKPDAERQAVLRGSITPERAWWDLQHYGLSIRFFPEEREIRGSNVIDFKATAPGRRMQIDLQPPLAISKAIYKGTELKFEREGNAYFLTFPETVASGTRGSVEVFYGGRPTESRNPPWSGGISWGRDDLGEHYITTTAQGIGASIWWPNKDHGADEPDRGMNINITVPEHLAAVSNGRLKKVDWNKADKIKTYRWQVVNPINNYGVNANIGNYVTWAEKYRGEGGVLDVSYWVLAHQKPVAMKHFKEVPRMLKAFEHWFGKYPFYEDGYKLVSVSYAGMEHQSSVTYGNWFRNGYRGRDYSQSGIGWKFDFIVVHESGHEWFGNNISTKDAADLWIHEGFTNYSESLFVDYWFGKKDADAYVVGSRKNIRNDSPIIGQYGTNREGSGDMYSKGGSLLHMIRTLVANDEKWRQVLRGLNKHFWHQTVTTNQVENYISEHTGMDLGKVFDQYLRTKDIPVFRYKIDGSKLMYEYGKTVDGFAMPLDVAINGRIIRLTPTSRPQTRDVGQPIRSVAVDTNYYVMSEEQR